MELTLVDQTPPINGEKIEIETETITHEPHYVTGWKLHSITLGLLLSLFLVQMDSSITSTSVLEITNELGGYEKSSWLFTSFLITYCGERVFILYT